MIETQGYFFHLAGAVYLLLFLSLCCVKQQKFFCCQDEAASRIITTTLILAVLIKIFFPLGQWFYPLYFANKEASLLAAMTMAMLAAIAVSYLEIKAEKKRIYLSLIPFSLVLNSFIIYTPNRILQIADLFLLNAVLMFYLHSFGGKVLLKFCTFFFLFFGLWIVASIKGADFLEKSFESHQRYKVHSKLKILQKRFLDLEKTGSSMAKIVAIMFSDSQEKKEDSGQSRTSIEAKLKLFERLSGVSGIYMLDKKGQIIMGSDRHLDSNWFASLPIFKEAVSGSSGISFFSNGQNSDSFFARPLIQRGEIVGAILLRYSLSKYFGSDLEQEGIYLLDKDGHIILGPNTGALLRTGNFDPFSDSTLEASHGADEIVTVTGEANKRSQNFLTDTIIHIPLFGGKWFLVKFYNGEALFKLRAGLAFVFLLISLVLMLLFLRVIHAKEFINRLEHEISERKRAQEAKELLADVVDQAIIGIVIANQDMEIQYINKCFQEMSGYSLDDLRKATIFSLLSSSENGNESCAEFKKAVLSGTAWRERITGIAKKDGSFFDADVSFFPLMNDEGQVRNHVIAFRDITHELALEAQLLEAHKMEAVGVLASGVAHDFNNMLAVIQFSTEMAKKRSEQGTPVWHNLDEIEKTVQRASSIVRQLLLFSKGKKAPLVKINLNHTLRDLETMFQQIAGTQTKVEIKPGPGLWDVLADKNCIELVLSNLIVNARDAMPDGGTISISTYNLSKGERCASGGFFADQDSVCLEIKDTGHGMDDDTVSHIFDPFFTTKDIGKGTGLGLSVVYGIIKQFGGKIEVNSLPGSGTIFCIVLPRAISSCDPRFIRASGGPGLGQSGYGVLLVEDEEMVKNIIRLALSEKGYKVFCASEVSEAERLLNQHQDDIDLVLCDIVLPDKNGLALADTLRKYYPDKKIVMVSGFLGNADTKQELLQNDLPYLAKPFTMADLFGVVTKALFPASEDAKN